MTPRRCNGGSGIAALAAALSLAVAPAAAQDKKQLERISEIPPSFGRCWKTPDAVKSFERTEITARFSIKRNGELIGEPRITFSTMPVDTKARALLAVAALSAIAQCTPVNVSESLGNAVAGKMISIRFIYEGKKGKGI